MSLCPWGNLAGESKVEWGGGGGCVLGGSMCGWGGGRNTKTDRRKERIVK